MQQILIAAALVLLMFNWMAPAGARADDAQPTTRFDIPKLDGITIDGNPDDWGDKGFRVGAFTDQGNTLRTRADFDASMRLGWNDAGLLILLRVSDDVHVEDPSMDTLYQKDSAEIFVGTGAGEKNFWQVIISPGFSAAQKELRQKLYDLRGDEALKKIPLRCDAKRTLTADGYVLEVLMSWESLGIKPELCRDVAFQIFINDADGAQGDKGGRVRSSWFPDELMPGDTHSVYTLRLADHASPPVAAAAWGRFERFRRTRINVIGTADLAGKSVVVKDGDKTLGESAMKNVDPTSSGQVGRAQAQLSLPMPPIGSNWNPLSVFIDGNLLQRVVLADPEDDRRNQLVGCRVVFRPAIFSAPVFPTGDFEEPAHAEDLIGPYKLSTRYFDAQYNELQKPAGPGRYGAVVTITAENGMVYKRYVTLYRLAKPLDKNAKFELALPPEAGIDPTVAKEQASAISDLVSPIFSDRSGHLTQNAVTLAALAEMKPGDGSESTINGIAARDFSWWHNLKKKIGEETNYGYISYVPDAVSAPENKDKKWPMIIYLHGGGEGGEDPSKIKKYALSTWVQQEGEKRFIVVDPQARRNDRWKAPLLDDLLIELLAKFPVDPDRVYVMGQSMGGMGTYDWIISSPQNFAAAVPICGEGESADAPRLKDLPIWMFHGDKDQNVPIGPDMDMFAALKAVGARTRFTIFHNDTHYIQWRTYKQPGLFDWLLAQKRGQPSQGPTTQPTIEELPPTP